MCGFSWNVVHANISLYFEWSSVPIILIFFTILLNVKRGYEQHRNVGSYTSWRTRDRREEGEDYGFLHIDRLVTSNYE